MSMDRIDELVQQCEDGLITPKEFRSSMVAQLSMLDDADTELFCARYLDKRTRDSLPPDAGD